MAKTLIKEYRFSPGLGIDGNARPNAVALLQENKTFFATRNCRLHSKPSECWKS